MGSDHSLSQTDKKRVQFLTSARRRENFMRPVNSMQVLPSKNTDEIRNGFHVVTPPHTEQSLQIKENTNNEDVSVKSSISRTSIPIRGFEKAINSNIMPNNLKKISI